MLRVFLGLGAVVCASWAQETGEPVYQTDFSNALVSPVNDPIDGGGEVQSGFIASTFSGGPGIIRMRLAPRGDDFSLSSGPSSWAEVAFISEAAGTNPATTIEEAVEAGAFIEFSLQSEDPADFTRIEFTMVGWGSNQSGSVTLRSSADNFSTDLETIGGSLNRDYPAGVILEGLPGFSNIRELTFRFYLYDSFEGHNNRLIGIDDVRVWAVPAGVPKAP